MQHSVGDGPGLHCRHAGCSWIGVDGDQGYPTGGSGSQPIPGIIHDLGSQWTEGGTPRVDEGQNYFATTQGRKGDWLTELIDELEVWGRIAWHGKAASCSVSQLRLCTCLVAKYEKPDSPGGRGHYRER